MKQMTIRAELADYLKKNGITINQFAEVSKVNSGTISNIINGNRYYSHAAIRPYYKRNGIRRRRLL